MSEEYRNFRKITLESLKTEQPGRSYRECMKIVSSRWNTLKTYDMKTLSPEEMIIMIDQRDCSESFFRRFRYTFSKVDDEQCLQWNSPNSLMNILYKLLLNDFPDKFLMLILDKFTHYTSFYDIILDNQFNLLDIIIRLCQPIILIKVIHDAPMSWLEREVFHSNDLSRLSCLFSVLFQVVKMKEYRSGILEFVKKSLSLGIDPNMEIGNPIFKDSSEYHYIEDHVFRYMKETLPLEKFEYFIHYTGIHDKGKQFRLRTISIGKNVPIHSFTGETLFSIYYEYGRERYHKRFCNSLLQMGLINPKVIFYSTTIEKPMTYLTMILQNNTQEVIMNGSLMFKYTPTYMLYVPSSGNPLKVFLDHMYTSWDVFKFSFPTSYPFLKKIFQHCLSKPQETFFNKLQFNQECFIQATSSMKCIPEGESPHVLLSNTQHPLSTGLAKILLTDFCLEKICVELNAGNYHDWQSGFTKEVLQEACSRNIETIRPEQGIHPGVCVKNEWYISDGTSIDVERDANFTFVSHDSYCFRYQELENMVEKKLNPFTRQPFSIKDIESMKHINDIYNEWWILFPDSHKINSLDTNYTTQTQLNIFYSKQIDEMVDKCPFFVYGERLTPLLTKFRTTDIIHACYLYLLTNPESLLNDLDVGFSNSSIGFQYSPSDHFTIEEINIYFSSKFSASIARNEQRSIDTELSFLLTWVLCILECTFTHEPIERFHGRIFTLQMMINRILKPLP